MEGKLKNVQNTMGNWWIFSRFPEGNPQILYCDL
jgi:hypothetical protein